MIGHLSLKIAFIWILKHKAMANKHFNTGFCSHDEAFYLGHVRSGCPFSMSSLWTIFHSTLANNQIPIKTDHRECASLETFLTVSGWQKEFLIHYLFSAFI